MTAAAASATICQHVSSGGSLILFLDYDGTLVPIARTPSEALPDASLLTLLSDLVLVPAFQTILLSGRPLATLQTLLPIPGLSLAGLYGVEIQHQGQQIVREVTPEQIRPAVAQVKAAWERLTAGRQGFLVEDKDLAVALHARWADSAEAEQILAAARAAAAPLLPATHFRILGGDRFLEVAPRLAHKGQTVEWWLEQQGPAQRARALPVYFGDDDKDEAAFSIIRRYGGIPIGVGDRFPLAQALERLPSPQTVRDWLRTFIDQAR